MSDGSYPGLTTPAPARAVDVWVGAWGAATGVAISVTKASSVGVAAGVGPRSRTKLLRLPTPPVSLV